MKGFLENVNKTDFHISKLPLAEVPYDMTTTGLAYLNSTHDRYFTFCTNEITFVNIVNVCDIHKVLNPVLGVLQNSLYPSHD